MSDDIRKLIDLIEMMEHAELNEGDVVDFPGEYKEPKKTKYFEIIHDANAFFPNDLRDKLMSYKDNQGNIFTSIAGYGEDHSFVFNTKNHNKWHIDDFKDKIYIINGDEEEIKNATEHAYEDYYNVTFIN